MSKHKNDAGEKLLGGTNFRSARRLDSLITNENKKNFRIHWTMNPETKKLVNTGEQHTMHGKFCMIDNDVLLMGSSPLDLQAMRCSREVDVCLSISKTKGNEILKQLFNTPYAFGRDYYVDLLIVKLNKQIKRLENNAAELSQNKASALKKLVDKLCPPGITPQKAYEILHSEQATLARELIKIKGNPWDPRRVTSSVALDECYTLIEQCCKQSKNVASEYDLEETKAMEIARNNYYNIEKPQMIHSESIVQDVFSEHQIKLL